MDRLGNRLPVRRVQRARDVAVPPPGSWPASIPAVREVLTRGLDLAPITVLVGENGAGKSTLVEGIAMAYGLSPEGGSTGARHSSRRSESPLHEWLWLDRGPGAPRWGFFARQETMHGFFSYLEANPGGPEPRFHEMSHGQSFLSLLSSGRFDSPGFFVFDEPEAGLAFSACLAVVGSMLDMVAAGGQVLVATHSPVVAAVPGARLLQVDEEGLRDVAWEDLDLVFHHRSFLQDPRRYLRHLDG